MIIKSFTAESAAAALKKVRSEMGGDAVVLKTRRLEGASGPNRIEVTACLDKPSTPPSVRPAADRETSVTSSRIERTSLPDLSEEPIATEEATSVVNPSGEQDDRLVRLEKHVARLLAKIDRLSEHGATTDVFAEKIRNQLIQSDTPGEFIDDFLTEVESLAADQRTTDSVRTAVRDRISRMIAEPPELKPGDSMVFVGPAGSGKTSLLGKLAARLVTDQKSPVRLLSLDKSGIAAYDEIQSYATILGIDIGDEQIPRKKDKAAKKVITLIDAPSFPADSTASEDLLRRVKAIDPTYTVAVFSALTRSSDILRIGEEMSAFRVTHAALTMTDLTPRRGPIAAINAAVKAGLVFVTDAPGGIGAISTPGPDFFVDRMIEKEANDE